MGTAPPAYAVSICEVEAGDSEVAGHLQLHREAEASLWLSKFSNINNPSPPKSRPNKSWGLNVKSQHLNQNTEEWHLLGTGTAPSLASPSIWWHPMMSVYWLATLWLRQVWAGGVSHPHIYPQHWEDRGSGVRGHPLMAGVWGQPEQWLVFKTKSSQTIFFMWQGRHQILEFYIYMYICVCVCNTFYLFMHGVCIHEHTCNACVPRH